jgi:hypothetical protein
MGLLTFLGSLLGLGGEALTRYQERKRVEAEAAVVTIKAEAEAKATIMVAQATAAMKRAEAAQGAEIAWDNLAADQARTSWKDEWFTLLLSTPLILAFLGDSGRAVVTQGFAALEVMPSWYVTMLSLAVAFAFGYRKLVETITSFRTPVVRR